MLSSSGKTSSSTTHTILNIEPNADIAELLKITFEQAGFKVVSLLNPALAIKRTAEIKPDVIVLDGACNQKVFRNLRRVREFDAIPIGIIELQFYEAAYTRYMQPFDAYVNRPCSREDLISMVRKMIDAKEARERS